MNEEGLNYIIQKMEEKLKELMLPEEYSEFSRSVAKETLRKEIEGMEDCEFKDFVLQNIDKITGTAQMGGNHD